MFRSKLKNSSRGNINTYIKNILKEFKTSRMNSELREISDAAKLADRLKEPYTAAVASKRVTKQQQQQLRRDKQQLASKKKTVPYLPGTVTLQVLGAGANGAPCSVYLFTDQSRYLFNCGEGTQRLAHEHKTKLARLEQIFVTRNTWSAIGGFPGLALTVQDSGVKELALHGPPHLDSILHSMKRFVVLKSLQVNTKDSTQECDFEDQVMTVKSLPLYKTTSAEERADNTRDDVVIAYICNLKPRPGALNLEKCVERGVPPGPLLGLLKNGIDITLDNGIVVKSEDVSEPQETALSFVFLDIPSEEYLPALQEQATIFQNLQQVPGQETALVVHFSPENILNNNCYIYLMQKFSPQTQHIYLNSSKNVFSGYIAAHRIQYQLNQLNERVFPLLAESEHLCNTLSNKLKKTKLIEEKEVKGKNDINKPQNLAADLSNPDKVVGVQSLTCYHIRPRRGFDHTQEAKLNPSEYIQETQLLNNFPVLLSNLKDTIRDQAENAQTSSFPKIIFLGTGSCIPNKTRNVSAILLQPCEDSYILLDCGEGTLGQIVRYFGGVKAEHVMRNLKAIYVSHLHADHHIGLIALLIERRRLLSDAPQQKKLFLIAPRQLEPWLDFYNDCIEQIDDTYELIGNSTLLENALDLSTDHKETGVRSIATCLVRHCPHSYGVSLILQAQHKSKPVKVTYSGDSMPCSDLVHLGRNSTILIHEATMEDDLVEEAKIKMHSTISQAIQQGREMQAEHIILTHFSQRYAKLPRMQSLSSEETEAEAMRNVAIAFDNMQVTLEDLQQFHTLYPALKALFAEHAEELEQKALKREMKTERKRKLLNID